MVISTNMENITIHTGCDNIISKDKHVAVTQTDKFIVFSVIAVFNYPAHWPTVKYTVMCISMPVHGEDDKS